MLVMRRRQGETILIGGEIEIHIAHIGRSRVKIAIRAPKDVRVVAKELQEVGEENRAAAATRPDAEVSARIARALAGKFGAAPPICVGEAELSSLNPTEPGMKPVNR